MTRRRTALWLLAAGLLAACGGGGGGVAGDAAGGGDGVALADGVRGDSGGGPSCPAGAPGEVLFTYDAGREIRGIPAVGTDGTVYVATMDFTVHAVDCTGARRWTYRFEPQGGGLSAPPHAFSAALTLGAGGLVHNGDALFALAAGDGAPAWTSLAVEQAGPMDTPAALSATGTLFLGGGAVGETGRSGRIYAVGAADGAVRAGFPVSLGQVLGAPVVVGDVVFVGHTRTATRTAEQMNHVVSAVGADGALLWERPLSDAVAGPYSRKPLSSLAVDASGRVLVVVSQQADATAAVQTKLLRLDPTSGAVVAETRLTASDCTGDCGPIVRGAGEGEEVFVVSSFEGLVDRVRPGAADSTLFIDPNFPGCRDCRFPTPAAGDDGLLYMVGGHSRAMEDGQPPLALLPLATSESGRGEVTVEYPFSGANNADNVSTSVQLGPHGVAVVGTRAGLVVAIRIPAGGLDPAAPWPALRRDAANTGRALR
jgi:outer membrane protein assembly factor BamB